jgi:hypothetical protein
MDAVDRGIPRRFSCRPHDPFFDQGLVARMSDRVAVLLDGVELAEVTSWDVDKGEIVRRARRPDGNFMLDERGACTFERLNGAVEVRWLPGMGL